MILFLIYLIGCYIAFQLISKNIKDEEVEQPMVAIAAMFSWFAVIILLIEKLYHKISDKK